MSEAAAGSWPLVTSLASLMAPSTEAPDPRATFITFNQDTT